MSILRGKTLRMAAALLAGSAGVPWADGASTAPFLVDAATIRAGDTAWMLTAVALVLLMTIPGLALFYGGMVRKKNVLAMVMQSFAITALVTVLWVVIGYSLAFTPGGSFVGGLWVLEVESRERAVELVENDPYYVPAHRSYRLLTWGKALADKQVVL